MPQPIDASFTNQPEVGLNHWFAIIEHGPAINRSEIVLFQAQQPKQEFQIQSVVNIRVGRFSSDISFNSNATTTGNQQYVP